MSSPLATYVSTNNPLIHRALEARLPASPLHGAERLNEALRYSVLTGGKRMRPVLALLAGEICGASVQRVLPAACAVEFLHAASLIFDDLPAMDNALMRHSRPCVHLVFGEGTAILAGLALMNEAYGILASCPALLARAAREIGTAGMIGGQAADMAGTLSRSRLEKTTALTRLTMLAGAQVGGASSGDLKLFASFGESLGEAYQISDDMADRLGEDNQLGKTAGQDQRNRRRSFVDELGMNACRTRVQNLIETSCERLSMRFSGRPQAAILEEFARSIPASALAPPLAAAHYSASIPSVATAAS